MVCRPFRTALFLVALGATAAPSAGHAASTSDPARTGTGGNSGGCVYDSIEQCREALPGGQGQRSGDGSTGCGCPCLPKCCPQGQMLVVDPYNWDGHGLNCAAGQGDATLENRLPVVPLAGPGGSPEARPSFFGPAFPACHGLTQKKWRYEMFPAASVTLNTTFEEEYILTVVPKSGGHPVSILSNFNNQGDRSLRSGGSHPRGQHGLGKKPLMHFCFDLVHLEHAQDQVAPMAVACPREGKGLLPAGVKVNKCCPLGKAIKDASIESCTGPHAGLKDVKWRLPINGYLFSDIDLVAGGNLVHNPNQSLLTPGNAGKCGRSQVFKEVDTFHLGPDGRIHFTDTHEWNVKGITHFCVDLLASDLTSTDDPNYEYEEYEYHDHPSRNHHHHHHPPAAGSDLVTQGPPEQKQPHPQCHVDTKPHYMVAVFCAEKFIEVRKCCDLNENLNLRARSCSSHKAKKWQNPDLYTLGRNITDQNPRAENRSRSLQLASRLKKLEGSKTRILVMEMNIYNMERDSLFVSSDQFWLLDNGRLLYQNRMYEEDKFCLDFSIDYCDGRPTASPRAIINDPDLANDEASTIFGTNKEDSASSRLLKQIGYPVSILFLMVTLSLYVVDIDLRKELYGKMVVACVSSLLVLYVCLFLRTFESAAVSPISKSSGACVFQALITYYFALSSFGWMTAMGYNIMTKFRSATLLPREADRQRFLWYVAFSYGLPALMSLLVLVLDRSLDGTVLSAEDFQGGAPPTSPGDGPPPPATTSAGGFNSDWRPGFGEESCWFTTCSNALSIFLYCPISVAMAANVVMFTFTAFKLHSMQKRVQLSRRPTKVAKATMDKEADLQQQVRTPIIKGAQCPVPDEAGLEDEYEASTSGSSIGGPRDATVYEGQQVEDVYRKAIARQLSAVSSSGLNAIRKKMSRLNDNKDRLVTFLKLFLAMGLTWVFEILAWIWSSKDVPAPEALIAIINLLNIFQGIWIFAVFATKAGSWHLIAKRLTGVGGKLARPWRRRDQGLLHLQEGPEGHRRVQGVAGPAGNRTASSPKKVTIQAGEASPSKAGGWLQRGKAESYAVLTTGATHGQDTLQSVVE